MTEYGIYPIILSKVCGKRRENMAIELYALRLACKLREEERAALWEILPPARAARLRRSAGAHCDEVLAAYGILAKLLSSKYGWEKLPPLSCGKNGKPFFADYPKLCFNLSHTRGAALVGISDRPIGVDIEKYRPVSARMRSAFPEAETERDFWDDWVRRESAVKCVGGSIASLRNRPLDAIEGECFFPMEPFEGYVACICTADKTITVKLNSFIIE